MATPPLVELGGSGPTLLLAVANGFPPAAYRPLLAPLLARFRTVSIPPRALWPDAGPPPSQAGSWRSLAADLEEGIRAHRLAPVIGVGHSFGAVSLLLAAARDPSPFRGLALLDPTIFVPERMNRIAAERAAGGAAQFDLTRAALRRRNRFASPAAAAEYFSHRSLFRGWSREAVEHYARAVLEPDPDGRGYHLLWSPEWEAWYYQSFYPDTWRDVARLDPLLPVLAVRGESSDTFTAAAARDLQQRLPGVVQAVVPKAGHLFPLSHPGETAELVEGWLARAQLAAFP